MPSYLFPKGLVPLFSIGVIKIFDDSQFKKYLMHVRGVEIFDDIFDSFDFANKLLTEAVNVIGKSKRCNNKNRNSANWENSRRNLVSTLRAQAINPYFHEKCRDVCNKKFWNTIKLMPSIDIRIKMPEYVYWKLMELYMMTTRPVIFSILTLLLYVIMSVVMTVSI